MSYNVLSLLNTLVHTCWNYDILNDQDMIIDCDMLMFGKVHFHIEMVQSDNCRVQYLPKEQPVEFKSYQK